MPTRSVSEIIDEWRAAERELDQCTTVADRNELARRVAALRAEHRAALEALDVEAHTLASFPDAERPGSL